MPSFAGMYAVSHHQEASYTSTKMSSRAELVMFRHQTLGSPPKSTLLKAIANFQLKSFPGFRYELTQKHLPPSMATDKRCMIRTRKGMRLTRNNQKLIIDAHLAVDNMSPPQQICTAIDHEMF